MGMQFADIVAKTEFNKLKEREPKKAALIERMANHPYFRTHDMQYSITYHKSWGGYGYGRGQETENLSLYINMKYQYEYIWIDLEDDGRNYKFKWKRSAQLKYREFSATQASFEVDDLAMDAFAAKIDLCYQELQKKVKAEKVKGVEEQLKLIGIMGKLDELINPEKREKFKITDRGNGSRIDFSSKEKSTLHGRNLLGIDVRKNSSKNTYQIRVEGRCILSEEEMLKFVSGLVNSHPDKV